MKQNSEKKNFLHKVCRKKWKNAEELKTKNIRDDRKRKRGT